MDRFNAFSPDELAVLVEILAQGVQTAASDAQHMTCSALYDEAVAAQIVTITRAPPASPDSND